MSTDPPRLRGQLTRAQILQAACDLFARRDPELVSVAEIAAAGGAHPHQITYYFGSKDGLLVTAAFRLLLRDARRLEPIALGQRTPEGLRTAVARAALALQSLPLAVLALSITRRRAELRSLAERDLSVLFRQAEEFLVVLLSRRGWTVDRSPAVEVRTFWSAVLGARLISESGFGGRSSDIDLAGTLTVRRRGQDDPAG